MSHDQAMDGQLLDLHLGALSVTDRAAVLQRVAADPRLAEQHAALSGVFSALRSAADSPPLPADLVQRTCARVASAPALRIRRPAATADASLVRRVFGLRDVIATAAMVVLIVGVGVPSLLHVRERGQRVMCSAQLAQIGQAMGSYATAHAGALPFAGWGPRASWAPSSDPAADVRPNRRHLFPVVRAGTVSPRALICPSTTDVPVPAAKVRELEDFPDARNLSFAYQNMAGQRPTLNRTPSDMPIVADDNPIFDRGRFLMADIPTRLGLQQPWAVNSRTHAGRGQNVLTLGGRVLWTTSPDVGIDGDNIWTLRGVQGYQGREGPGAETDSHLLK
ncbi:MAG: hypothetical protein IPM64_11845 [Phycisphaerales bacterium]|nr:hypothetical protein [Phycisphaerales bacterium]